VYRIVPGQWLTYWFFYAYSDSEGTVNHQGDWERITIQLDGDNRPVRVAFHGHGGHCLSEWSVVDKAAGTHPIVYSSVGDHASFPRPGTRKMHKGAATDKCADGGQTWDLSRRNLLDVTTRPWYGYTGASGEPGPGLRPLRRTHRRPPGAGHETRHRRPVRRHRRWLRDAGRVTTVRGDRAITKPPPAGIRGPTNEAARRQSGEPFDRHRVEPDRHP
jgi:hypothetical protein